MQPSGVRPIPAVHRSLSRGVPVDKELGIRDKGIGELESGVGPSTVGLGARSPGPLPSKKGTT